MIINITHNTYLVFDLDDTLYKEIDYLKSAFRAIAELLIFNGKLEVRPHDLYLEMFSLYEGGLDVFENIIRKYKVDYLKSNLLHYYRTHVPNIELLSGLKEIFEFLIVQDIKFGIITDGREVTQVNKLKALGILDDVSDVVISETIGSTKPCIKNFTAISDKYTDYEFFYFGDNPAKDFLTPNKLGWSTVCLIGDGRNIHNQNVFLKSEDYQPLNTIESWEELKIQIIE